MRDGVSNTLWGGKDGKARTRVGALAKAQDMQRKAADLANRASDFAAQAQQAQQRAAASGAGEDLLAAQPR